MKLKYSIFYLLLILGIHAKSQESNVAYLCAYMDGKEQDLRYCISPDGYHFEQVNKGNTILKSTIGGKIIRDPQIITDQNGVYHLISTNAWGGREIGLWDSKDLIHWENERVVTIAPENADKTWAPEAIYNKKDKNYLFYWTSSLSNDTTSWSIYCATTTDFIHFSSPTILMKSDRIILDAHIVKASENKYLMFYRYNSQIWVKEASSLLGEYINGRCLFTDNGEGPYVYKISDKKWNMVWDYYTEWPGFYGMAETDNLRDWKIITEKKRPFYNQKVSFPEGVRHGSIIPISKKQFAQISSATYNTQVIQK